MRDAVGMLKRVQHDARWRVVVDVAAVRWQCVRHGVLFRQRFVGMLEVRHPGLDPGSPSYEGCGRDEMLK